jgi:UDP-GlcNAc3NAcA epimerase
MKITTVLGARPQFIKASVVSNAFQQLGISETIIHTGQHFDRQMSDVFFQDLDLPEPQYNLNIHSLNHGAMTGRMMEQIEAIFIANRPDYICIYGDTNSTLAGALVGAKLHIPIAHVEAGLRSFNREMPEEINRVVADSLATLLFAPTELAVTCLAREGIGQGVHLVGDVMMDAVLKFRDKAEARSEILQQHQIDAHQYYLATIHRPSNTDNISRLEAILASLTELDRPVVFPVHPRTMERVKQNNLSRYFETDAIKAIPPVSYLDMLALEANCAATITDSGGIQKECYILGRPCFTLRTETEWQETVESGWNELVEPETLKEAIAKFVLPRERTSFYGTGEAAMSIAKIILQQ